MARRKRTPKPAPLTERLAAEISRKEKIEEQISVLNVQLRDCNAAIADLKEQIKIEELKGINNIIEGVGISTEDILLALKNKDIIDLIKDATTGDSKPSEASSAPSAAEGKPDTNTAADNAHGYIPPVGDNHDNF